MPNWYKVFKGLWKCPKCDDQEIIIDEYSFTGTGLLRLLDWQSYEYVAAT